MCILVLDLAKRVPEHLLPEDYTDGLQSEYVEFAIATDEELPPMDVDLDAFWAAMPARSLQEESIRSRSFQQS